MQLIEHFDSYEAIDRVFNQKTHEERISHLLVGPNTSVLKLRDQLFSLYPPDKHNTEVVATNFYNGHLEMVIHRLVPQ